MFLCSPLHFSFSELILSTSKGLGVLQCPGNAIMNKVLLVEKLQKYNSIIDPYSG